MHFCGWPSEIWLTAQTVGADSEGEASVLGGVVDTDVELGMLDDTDFELGVLDDTDFELGMLDDTDFELEGIAECDESDVADVVFGEDEVVVGTVVETAAGVLTVLTALQ